MLPNAQFHDIDFSGANFTGTDFTGLRFYFNVNDTWSMNNTWSDATCPDGTNSDDADNDSCNPDHLD